MAGTDGAVDITASAGVAGVTVPLPLTLPKPALPSPTLVTHSNRSRVGESPSG
jgi:hypothetical protein